jgi:hypothetical protein
MTGATADERWRTEVNETETETQAIESARPFLMFIEAKKAGRGNVARACALLRGRVLGGC